MRAIPAGIGIDALQIEARQAAVVLHQLALALHHVDQDVGLPVDAGGEVFGRAGRDGRIAMDQLRNHAAHGLDAERERRHVEQQLVLHGARQNRRLHGGAERDHFVRIQLGVRLGAEQVFDRRAHQRNARRSAHHHHFVDLIRPSRRRL